MKKNILTVLSFILAGSTLTSCLKDDSLVLNPEKTNNVIEFANPTQIVDVTATYKMYSFQYDLAPEVTLPITVQYAGAESGAPQDITVKIAPGTEEQVDTYNEEGHQDVELSYMPASNYTLSTTEVVIKQGQKQATFNVVFKPTLFDFNKSLALPLTIASASSGVVSGNFGTILLNVGAKNKWDGSYKFTGSARTADGVPDRTNVYQAGPWVWPGNINLVTSSLTTVDLYDDTYNFGGGTAQWLLLLGASPTTGGGFGQARPRFTIDDATNKVTAVVNAFPNPTNGRAFAIDPTYNNKYDPATKTFDFRFIFTQPNFKPLFVNYKFTYDHAR